MPIVSHDSRHDIRTPPARTPSDPVSRLRRLVGSARDAGSADSAGIRALEEALARVDAPVDLRIRGGLSSGRRTLAEALRVRRGWRAGIDDVDELVSRVCRAGTAGPAPDVEIFCLRTAPCRHEEAWLRAPRVHPLLTVATGIDPAHAPAWSRGLPTVDARDPDDRSVDVVAAFLDRALAGLASVRRLRLEAELERLAVRAGSADLAESALCALDGTDRA